LIKNHLQCAFNETLNPYNYDQKIECLRSKSTDQLLDAMSMTENQWVEIAPQPDSYVMPVESVSGLFDHWPVCQKRSLINFNFQGIPLLITTTEEEFFMRIRPTVEGKCQKLIEDFGYEHAETTQACTKYYNSTADHPVRDAYHAFMHKIASINTRLGHPTFAGIFAQAHGVGHAGDLKYLMGLHPLVEKDQDDLLMDRFYPMLMRNFVTFGQLGMGGKLFFRLCRRN
jgi:hypothetical protein